MTIRSLYLSEANIAGWESVGVYSYDADQKTTTLLSDYSASSTAMTLYEVSVVVNSGSWWLFSAVSDEVPQTWWDNGGAEALQATGDVPTTIDGDQVYRPTLLVWWIPEQTLADQSVSPTIVNGDVDGDFPLVAPSETPPDNQITVVQTADSVTVTVPPQTTDTIVTITVDS